MLTNDAEPLQAALVEIERYVARAGWDQPARLFGLVETERLLADQPQLADQIHVTAPGALSSVEQDEFNPGGEDLMTALTHIGWPDTFVGAAIATERSFLPPDDEAQIPRHPYEAAQFVAHHPDRQDVRVVAGALRGSGVQACVARLSSQPEELLMGSDMVPALTRALAMTLEN